MTDLILKFNFTDRGGNAVYDVMHPDPALVTDQSIGQVRIPPDPRIAELQAEVFKLKQHLTSDQLIAYERAADTGG